MGQRVPPSANERFSRAERRGVQQARAESQGQREALNRRFAALGLQGSGAAIKAEQQLGKQTAQRVDDVRGRIADAREQQDFQREQIQEGRRFQTAEREASQAFGAEQAALGREFAAGESRKGRSFQAGQARLGRDFASSEAGKQRSFAASESALGRDFARESRDLDLAFKEKLSMRQQKQFYKQINEQARQFDEQLDLDRWVSEINRQNAAQAARDSKSGLFGSLGF